MRITVGKMIGEGPVRSSNSSIQYDEYDLSEMMCAGNHVLALHVSQMLVVRHAPLALIAELELDDQTIISDNTWKYLHDHSYRLDTPSVCWIRTASGDVEIRDLNAVPDDWERIEYDDSYWPTANYFYRCDFSDKPRFDQPVHAIDAYWRYLIKRDFPKVHYKDITPKSIVKTGECLGGIINANRALLGPFLWDYTADVVENTHSEIKTETGSFSITMQMGYCGESTFGRSYFRPAVIFDFGELMNARVCFEIECSETTVINITYDQTMLDGKIHPYTGAIYRAMRYILKKGRNRVMSYHPVNFRYLQLTVDEAYSPVRLIHISAKKSEYPLNKATFSCSDEKLNKIFKADQLTIENGMRDIFVDNTWRENNAWGGDVTVGASAATAHFGTLGFTENYLKMFAYNQNPEGSIPLILPHIGGTLFDHQLNYIIRVYEYYYFSGNQTLIKQLYPTIRKLMCYFERYENDNGLLEDIPDKLWFDWADLDQRELSVTLNLWYYYLLDRAVKLAEAAEYHDDILIYQDKMQTLRKQRYTLYQQSEHAFPDSLMNLHHISENTNGMALCSGFADKHQTAEIIESVFEKDFSPAYSGKSKQCGPPFASHVLTGLCKCGRVDLALRFILERVGSAVDQGLETLPETWNFFPSGEVSAAQSTVFCAPVLLFEVLGIKAASPGFNNVLIEPNPCHLTHAEGRVITPNGIINLCWHIEGDSIKAICRSPRGVSVKAGVHEKYSIDLTVIEDDSELI